MKKNKISILYVDPFISIGGQEMYLINIISRLDRNSFDIHIACPKENALIRELEKIKDISFCDLSMAHKFDLISIIKLWYYIKINHIDIVHLNGGRAGLIGRIAGIFTSAKIVFTPHSLIFDYRQSYNSIRTTFYILIDRLLNKCTDYIVAVCYEQTDRIKNLNHISNNKIVTIYNGIDENLFYPSKTNKSLLNELDLKDNIPVIGFIGRLVHQKGVKYLLKACGGIDYKNWQLLIVGDGPEKDQLMAFSKKQNIENKIIFSGERSDIPSILSIFDIFVLPSLFEGFPLSILEAMAVRLPIVATNINGIPEAIQHKNNGYLISPQDNQELASVLDYLLKNPYERKRIAKNARETYLKHFTLKKMMTNTEKFYHSLISIN